jgi:predicted nucleic acid-binding protein
MRLVVDTNILVSATINRSRARALLLHPGFHLFAPEYALHEIEKHYVDIMEKSGLNDEDCRNLLDALVSRITIVPRSEFEQYLPRARKVMETIDEDDISFIALALSFKNDGIWSNDKHFQRQHAVRAWTTGELLDLL